MIKELKYSKNISSYTIFLCFSCYQKKSQVMTCDGICKMSNRNPIFQMELVKKKTNQEVQKLIDISLINMR